MNGWAHDGDVEDATGWDLHWELKGYFV